jgi:hypothetical protein
MTNDLIALIANLALALSFVVGLIFGIAQVKAAARDRKERLTLETLRTFRTHEFAEIMQRINSLEIPATLEEWRKLPDKDQVMFIHFTQEMETLGILVAKRYINIGLVDITLGSYVTTVWNKLKPSVTDMRDKLPDPYLNEYFQWLAERIDERMRNNPRKPFHEV